MTQRIRSAAGLCALLSALVWFALTPWLHAADSPPVTVVNVLVLYTPQARDGAGGTAAIQSKIEQAMREANQVFQNSRVHARLRLAHRAEISYAESGSVATDLARLRDPHDNFLDEAHALREEHRADLVCLVTETGDDWWFYGLQGPSAANAFSLIRRSFLTAGYSFPVVLSFNFGCQLERRHADSVGAFPYSYGWSFWGTNGGRYSTVEAFSGTRLPMFSNPDLQHEGAALGVPAGLPDAADNARVLNLTAPMVAAFRSPAPTTVPPAVQVISPASGDAFFGGSNLTLLAAASDADGHVVRVEFYANEQSIGAATNAPWTLVWTNAPELDFEVIAVVVDNDGAATISEPVFIQVRPTNDDFANARLLAGTNDFVSAWNYNATEQADEPVPDFLGNHQTLWWSYTAPASGVLWVSALDSVEFTEFTVYIGDALTNLTSVCFSPGTPPPQPPSAITVTGGTTYFIQTDTTLHPGRIILALALTAFPPNDNFTNRAVLNGSWLVVTNSCAAATLEPDEPNHAGTGLGNSIWWAWVAPASGRVSLSSPSGHVLAVYLGAELANLAAVAGGQGFEFGAIQGTNYSIAAVGGGADVMVELALSTVRFAAPADGAKFLIGENILLQASTTEHDGAVRQVEFFQNGSSLGISTSALFAFVWTNPPPGTYTLAAEAADGEGHTRRAPAVSIQITPLNDDFGNRFALTGAVAMAAASNLGATMEEGEPGHSWMAWGNSLWWTWTAPTSGVVAVGSPTGHEVAVYVGDSVTNLTLIPNGSSGGTATFEVSDGTTYDIAVVGYPGEMDLTLSFSTVRWLAPTDGAAFFTGAPVPLEVVTTEFDGPVQRVEFLAGGQVIGVATNPPYALLWTNAPASHFTLSAAAVDESGARTPDIDS